MADTAKVNVIYCRYSSELQRVESIADQERRCRDWLERKGINHATFVLISDEAISGESDERPGFQRLKELIYSGRLGLLVVAEQSRLSRGDDVKGLIKDIVFHGGRFVSVAEGIDTDHKGWKLLVGISEIHHARSNEDTAERVRGGQEGRVRDGNGSAGDFPYGYRSEYADPAAAAAFRGRGPKPKKVVVIDEDETAVVRQIFARFIARHSISAIVQWLNSIRDTIPRVGNRNGRGLWHHEHVRRILMNAKYIGRWEYGRTTSVHDRLGASKQIPARQDQRVTVVERPTLRIIEQPMWDAAQARLEELLEIYGLKEGQQRRGPAHHYRQLYQRTILNGMITCDKCGSTLIDASSNGIKRLGCPRHRAGNCTVASRVRLADAERAVMDVLEQVLTNYPEWIQVVIAEMRQTITEKLRQIPTEQQAVTRELASVQAEIDNLLNLAATGVNSQSLAARLAALETRKSKLAEKAERIGKLTAKDEFPDDGWVKQQVRDLTGLVRGMTPEGVQLIRSMIRPVIAQELKCVGKTRGFMRLRFRLHAWSMLRHILQDRLPKALLDMVSTPSATHADGAEFVIDLGRPSRMDLLAPRIMAWREQGVAWKEIARRTGLKLSNAYLAYKRYRDAGGKAA